MTNETNDQDYLDILKMLETDDSIPNERNVTFETKNKEERKDTIRSMNKSSNVTPLLATVAPIRNENIISSSTSGISNLHTTSSKMMSDVHNKMRHKLDETSYSNTGPLPLVSNIVLPGGLTHQQLQYAPPQFLGTTTSSGGSIVCLMAPQLTQQTAPISQPDTNPYQFVLPRSVVFTVPNTSPVPTPPPQTTSVISNTIDTNRVTPSSIVSTSVSSTLPKLLPKPQQNSRLNHHHQMFHQAQTMPNIPNQQSHNNIVHSHQQVAKRPAVSRKSNSTVRQRNTSTVNPSNGNNNNRNKNGKNKDTVTSAPSTTPVNPVMTQTTCSSNLPSQDNILMAWENAEQSDDQMCDELPEEFKVYEAPPKKPPDFYINQSVSTFDYHETVEFIQNPPKYKRGFIQKIPALSQSTVVLPQNHFKCSTITRQKPLPTVNPPSTVSVPVTVPPNSLCDDVNSRVMQLLYSHLNRSSTANSVTSNPSSIPFWKYLNALVPNSATGPPQTSSLSICTEEDDDEEEEEEISPALNTSTRTNPSKLARLDYLLQAGCNPNVSPPLPESPPQSIPVHMPQLPTEPPYHLSVEQSLSLSQFIQGGLNERLITKKSTTSRWLTECGGSNIRPTKALEQTEQAIQISDINEIMEYVAKKKINYLQQSTHHHHHRNSDYQTYRNDKKLKKYHKYIAKIKSKREQETEEVVNNTNDNITETCTNEIGGNWMISDSGVSTMKGSLKIKLKLNLTKEQSSSTAPQLTISEREVTPPLSPLNEKSPSPILVIAKPNVVPSPLPRIPTPEPVKRTTQMIKKRTRNNSRVETKRRKKSSVTLNRPKRKIVAPPIMTPPKIIPRDDDEPSPPKKIFYTRKEDRRSSTAALSIDVGNCTNVPIPCISAASSFGANTSTSTTLSVNKRTNFLPKGKKTKTPIKSNNQITPSKTLKPPIILKLKAPKPPPPPPIESPTPEPSPIPPDPPTPIQTVIQPTVPLKSSGSMKVRIKRTQETGDAQVVVPPSQSTTSQFDFDDTATTVLAPPPLPRLSKISHQPARQLTFSPASSDAGSSDRDDQHESICRKLLEHDSNLIQEEDHCRQTRYLVGTSPTVFIDDNKVDLVVVKNSSYKKMATIHGSGNTPNTNNPTVPTSSSSSAPNNSVEVFLPGCFMQNESPSMPVLAPQEPLQIKMDRHTDQYPPPHQQHTPHSTSPRIPDYSQSYFNNNQQGIQIGGNTSSGSLEDMMGSHQQQQQQHQQPLSTTSSNSYGGVAPQNYHDNSSLSGNTVPQQQQPPPQTQTNSNYNTVQNNDNSHNTSYKHKRVSNDSTTSSSTKQKRSGNTPNSSVINNTKPSVGLLDHPISSSSSNPSPGIVPSLGSGFLNQAAAASLSSMYHPTTQTSHHSHPNSTDFYSMYGNSHNDYYNHLLGDYLYNTVPGQYSAMVEYYKSLQQQSVVAAAAVASGNNSSHQAATNLSATNLSSLAASTGALHAASAGVHNPSVPSGLLQPSDYTNASYPYGMPQSSSASYIYSGFGIPK